MKSRFVVSCCMLLAASAAQAAAPLAQPFDKPVSKLCSDLQGRGWTPPRDERTNKLQKAELVNAPGTYACMLTSPLAAAGTGHAPGLIALFASYGKGPKVILTANVWCAADRAPAFTALANELERIAGPAPKAIVAAIRAGKEAKVSDHGLDYQVDPVDVDPDACSKVPPGQAGPLLIELDVAVSPAQ